MHNYYMIPALEPTTLSLPLGRYGCTLNELKQRYVEDQAFVGSTTRNALFQDFLAAGTMLDQISKDLVEMVWVGGSFVTGTQNPDDIDCTFIISGPMFRALPSNSQRHKVMKFNSKGWLRSKLNLRVESFILVREPIANPWQGAGLHADAVDYLSVRGAWDDWWMRVRTNPDKTAPPTIEDAEPKRGYLEVNWHEI